jgi:hypothetical protein
MIGGFIFAPALLFSIISKDNKAPLRTSLPTAFVLTAYLIVYATMHFWLAFISTALTAAAWYILAWQRFRKD